jgi:hypothetical protein
MTPNEAKKIIKAELERRSLPFTKLTAKTWDLVDLARDYWIVVTIHGWKSNPALKEIKELAKSSGFGVGTDGLFG